LNSGFTKPIFSVQSKDCLLFLRKCKLIYFYILLYQHASYIIEEAL